MRVASGGPAGGVTMAAGGGAPAGQPTQLDDEELEGGLC